MTAAFILTTTLLWWFMVDKKASVSTQESKQTVDAKQRHQLNAVKSHQTNRVAPLINATTQSHHQSIEQSLAEPSMTSLSGSTSDGAVNFNAFGEVQIDSDLHQLFDHYLSMAGEQPIETIRSMMLNTAGELLSQNQLSQLQAHFDRYIDYLKLAEEHANIHLNTTDGLEHIEVISQLRRDLLGEAMAEAFFGEEEAYARHVIQMQLTGTSDAPEAQQIKWLNAENLATAYHDVLIENQQFNDSHANASQRMNIRTAAYGDAVAQQLAQLDHSQQQWRNTVNHYIQTRSRLEGNPSALNQLEQNYSPTELKRLHAYYRAQ